MRLILPIILIVAAVGLFVVYTNPQYQVIKGLQVQASAFDDALNKAQQLKSERDKLLAKRRTFTTENVQKLERVLPDNVDNIRLIIDINNIASRHTLTLKNVALGTVSDSKSTRSTLAVGSSGEAVGSVDVGFVVNAGYDDLLSFLADLEHSLRIVDVERISFKAGTDSKYDIAMTIRTYWLH